MVVSNDCRQHGIDAHLPHPHGPVPATADCTLLIQRIDGENVTVHTHGERAAQTRVDNEGHDHVTAVKQVNGNSGAADLEWPNTVSTKVMTSKFHILTVRSPEQLNSCGHGKSRHSSGTVIDSNSPTTPCYPP